MKRMEITGSRAVEKEVVCALRDNIQGFYYTLLPQIPGGDEPDYQSENGVWTNLNFLLISFLEEKDATRAQIVIGDIKHRFPDKGIRHFYMEVA